MLGKSLESKHTVLPSWSLDSSSKEEGEKNPSKYIWDVENWYEENKQDKD